MDFGNVLKGLRVRRDMTQKELADVLGVSESTVGMYERGKREPNFETLEAIADFFNVDMEYLMGKTNIERRAAYSPRTGEAWEAAPNEMDDLLQTLKDQPGRRILFDKTKNATPEQIRAIAQMIDLYMGNQSTD